MIVRPGTGTIHLITQPDHAQLAGQIMSRSRGLRDHPRRASILRAVAEHDNGWREEDEAPTVDASGAVVDFVTAPLAVRHRVWPRGVSRLMEDPWAAALVAQHAITVYDRYRSDRAWDSFFAGMEVLRDRTRDASGVFGSELLADYTYVRLGDLISLAFCTGWADEHHFNEWTVRLEGDRVHVTPDPFDGHEVPLRVAVRQLPHRAFHSGSELRESIRHAPTLELTGVVRAGG